MLSIELILTTGSKAGTPAPIQPGYYMVGRHAECQIRPKSRSVSRRHCLLHHGENGLTVLDLRSTQGTHVNEEMIEPHTWTQLKDGDQIQCGKVSFEVSIKQAVAVGTSGTSAPKCAAASSNAWQEEDIAQFLDSEDEAEREQRYGKIRSSAGETTETSRTGELDQYHDTPLEKDDSTPVESNTANESKAGSSNKKTRDAAGKIPKKKARGPKKLREPRISFSLGDGDQLKLLGAIVLVVVLLGFLGHQIYHYSSGPEIQVLENID